MKYLFSKKDIALNFITYNWAKIEVKLGKLLGTGGFCSVFEVNKLDLTSVKADRIEADMGNGMSEVITLFMIV